MKKLQVILYLCFGFLLSSYCQTYTICCDQNVYVGQSASALTLNTYESDVEWFSGTSSNGLVSEGNYGPTFDGGILYPVTETIEFYAVVNGIYTTNTIFINALPQFHPGTITPNKTICSNTAGGTISFASPPSGGDNSFTYKWMVANPGGAFSYTGDVGTTINVGNLTSTKRYCCEVDGGAGVDYTNESVISVSSNFNQGSIGNSQELCYNTPAATLTNITNPVNGKPPYIYEWQYSPNGTSSWSSVPGGNEMGYSPGILTDTSYYRRLVTDDCSSSGISNIIAINVLSKLPNPITDAKNIYCRNDSVKIQVTNPLASNKWYNNKKELLGNFTHLDLGKLTEEKEFYLNSLDEHGCTTDTLSVRAVVDSIKADFRVTNGQIKVGESAGFINLSKNAANYAWDLGEVDDIYTTFEPTFYYYQVGWYDVSLKVTSLNNCSDSLVLTKAVKVIDPNTIDDKEFQHISIYPLPTANILTIDNKTKNIANVFIYNTTGQLVKMQLLEEEENSVDVSAISSGIFILKVVSDNETIYSQTLIKR